MNKYNEIKWWSPFVTICMYSTWIYIEIPDMTTTNKYLHNTVYKNIMNVDCGKLFYKYKLTTS